jgi:hypothetical protein
MTDSYFFLEVDSVKRYWSYVLAAGLCVLLLVTGPLLTVFGQNGNAGPTVNCNGLSDADCQILQDAASTMQTVSSFSIPAWSVNLAIDAGPQSMNLDADGHGAAVLPPSLMGLMGNMQGLNIYATPDAIIDFYSQLNSEMLLQALTEAGLSLAIDHADLQAPDQASSTNADVIYKDQGLYLRLESPNGAQAWFGQTVTLSETNIASLDQSLADLLTQLQSDDFRQTWAQVSEFSGLSQRLSDLANKYIVTTRGDDTEMMGQTMNAFTTTFDLKALLNDPDLPGLLIDFFNNPALSNLGANTSDLSTINETQVQFLLMTAGLLLKDATFSMSQWVGADDGYIHQFDLNAALNLDLSLLGTRADIQAVNVDAAISVEMADFNADVMAAVEVPAEYVPLDKSDDFLVGDSSMIEQELALGQTFAAAFSANDSQDIYSLPLEAGQAVTIELNSKDYPYLNLYGPDGFLIGEFDTYDTDSLEFTAETTGTYLVVVKAYWEMNYEITIRAQ